MWVDKIIFNAKNFNVNSDRIKEKLPTGKMAFDL